MPVRLKDIADDLGVSIITVSKVLRNHRDISEKTRVRVLQRIKELNYQPNMAARALVTGRTSTVGLMVPELTLSFFSQIAKGLHLGLRRKGYGLIISSSLDDQKLEQQEISNLLARRVDALVIATTLRSAEPFHQIEADKVPFILIDRSVPGLDANFIGVDDRHIGMLATHHLLEIGCRHVGHIHGPNGSAAEGRWEGFRQALAEKGIPYQRGHVTGLPFSDKDCIENGYKAMRRLLSKRPRPDGIFCFNDPSALGAMKAVIESGLRIPHDVAIIGCGNFLYSDFLQVPLSTVDQSAELIGDHASKLALRLVESKTAAPPKTILLEPRLIIRESTSRKQ